ncbi:F-box/kelch-repeat protein-like protein [Tanacetum coccineum]
MSSYVCEDLMDNIFKRLPHKSVIRFRSLSKSLYSRLASPEFVRMHTLRSLKKTNSHKKVLLRHSFEKDANIFTLHSPRRLPLNPKRGYMGITGVELPYDISGALIVGSCNGILCLKKQKELILWNFSVRRKLVVPTHPSIGASEEGPSVLFGFGYDRVTHDYNIVGISYFNDAEVAYDVNSFIYSMKTNSWSMIASPTSSFIWALSNVCTILNEKLHWRMLGKHSGFIMTFSLTTRVFGKIQLPYIREHIHPQLAIINGSLAVISLSSNQIWVRRRKDYGNVKSWFIFSELKTEGYKSIYVHALQPNKSVHVFQPITNGALLLYDAGDRKIYDDETNLYTKILEFRPNCCDVEMETYVETLELLDRGIPCGTTIFPLTKTYKRERSEVTSLDDGDGDGDSDDNDGDDDDDDDYDEDGDDDDDDDDDNDEEDDDDDDDGDDDDDDKDGDDEV